MSDDLSKFATALATGVSSYVSKAYSLDNVMYTSINTIVTLMSIYSLAKVNGLMEKFGDGFKINYTYLTLSVITIIILFSVLKTKTLLGRKISELIFGKNNNVTLRGKYMIENFVEYMRNHTSFYKCDGKLVVEDNVIHYQKSTDRIFFDDTNFKVRGYITFINLNSVKQNVVDEKKPDVKADAQKDAPKQATETKVEATPVIKNDVPDEIVMNIEKCHIDKKSKCRDVIEYIDSVIGYGKNCNCSEVKVSGYNFAMMKEYVNQNKKMFLQKNVFNEQQVISNNDIFFEVDKTIQFNDTNFDVSGFIKWTRANYGTIFITKYKMSSDYTMEKYMTDIIEWVKHKQINGGKIVLYSVNKTFESDVVRTMYDGVSKPIDYLEKTYIETLFHKDILVLWELIKNIHYFPEKLTSIGQSPRLNLLLHGPPGTGKSTFAYRIAMATRRHILNVKLSKYSKSELLDVFSKPKIKGEVYSPKNVIFVLDEFDQDIDKILVNQKSQQEQIKISKTVALDVMKADTHIVQNVNIIKPQAPTEPDKVEITTTKQNPADITNIVKDGKGKLEKIEETINSISKFYEMINKIENNIITMEDLLTLFQGSVPIEGCIIIAMTNRYHELQDTCPALFRAGRLSPYYFGNFDMDMMNRVSKYYFGRHIGDKLVKTEFQPSKIMEIIMTAMMSKDKQYDYFVDELKRL